MNINVLRVAAWDGLDKTMIINLFKSCALTVAVDGSEDGPFTVSRKISPAVQVYNGSRLFNKP